VKRIVLSLIFLYVGAPVWAQNALGSNELSLDEAIRIALEKNYDARSAQLSLESAEVSLDRAEAKLLPDVAASSRYIISKPLDDREELAFGFLSTGETNRTASQINDYSLGGAFNLYAGGGDAANIRSAGYALDAAKYGLKWARQNVAFGVTSAYIDALRTKELLNAAEKTLAESQAQLERVRGLHEAGSIAVGQVYQQEALVGQQELESINAKNQYDNARTDLFFLLNLPQDALRYDVTTRGIDTSVLMIKGRTPTVSITDAAIADILNRREDFLATKSSILASESAIDVTRSALLPQLDLTYSIGGDAASQAFKFDRLMYENNLQGGLRFSWSLFDRSQTRLSAELQEINIQLDKIRLEQDEQSFRTEIVKANNTLRSAERAVEASERALRAAEEATRLATERVRVGAGIQVDVIVAQSQLQTARTNRVNAIYNYVFAQKQLEYLLGRWNY
jgi:outer membrane protein